MARAPSACDLVERLDGRITPEQVKRGQPHEPTILIEKLQVGDTYAAGQAGSIGPGAQAAEMSFEQVSGAQGAARNLGSLAASLLSLRDAMRARCANADQELAIAEIAIAEDAAIQRNEPKVMEYLRKAGQWALEIAAQEEQKGIHRVRLMVMDDWVAVDFTVHRKGEVWESESALTIGRLEEMNVRLNVYEVSRRHAEIQRGMDAWYVRDLGSKSGTFVNGSRLEAGKASLKPKDILRIGKINLSVDFVHEGTGIAAAALKMALAD
jgi:hypothetical protein